MTPYELAKKEVGTVEWAQGSNPKVVAYFKDAGISGIKDDETAWCAAFVGAMINRSGSKGTGKPNARSYLKWGIEVDPAKAKEGDIVVFKRGNSTWQGHVGFFVKQDGKGIHVLGGNQKDAVNVSIYSPAALLGIRRAAGVAVPAPKPAPVQPPKDHVPVAAPSESWLVALMRAILALFNGKR